MSARRRGDRPPTWTAGRVRTLLPLAISSPGVPKSGPRRADRALTSTPITCPHHRGDGRGRGAAGFGRWGAGKGPTFCPPQISRPSPPFSTHLARRARPRGLAAQGPHGQEIGPATDRPAGVGRPGREAGEEHGGASALSRQRRRFFFLFLLLSGESRWATGARVRQRSKRASRAPQGRGTNA